MGGGVSGAVVKLSWRTASLLRQASGRRSLQRLGERQEQPWMPGSSHGGMRGRRGKNYRAGKNGCGMDVGTVTRRQQGAEIGAGVREWR